MTDTEKKRYLVADPAAVFVAGVRVGEDRTIELTEAQARYPLLSEQISLEKPRAAPKVSAAKPLEG
jgi:hypothetical protein